ncbi:MAG: amidohydrolase family protein [bacterium]|nr:amidohydrolase family protein [bacterium]
MDYLDLKQQILEKIKANGGWVNAHAHFDRAYSLNDQNVQYIYKSLQEKWDLNDELKKNSSVDDVYNRMVLATEHMLEQGVTAVGTFIDIDEAIEDKAIQAAQKLRDTYKGQIEFKFINQVLKGVLDPEAKKWFDLGTQFVDIIGGLPGKDVGREAEHIDVLLSTAKKMNKMAHIHVDQLNTPKETETMLLAQKTIEHGMQGKVAGIHGISIAAHPKEYRDNIYKTMKEADVMMVACPVGWIDHKRNEELLPFHNALTPVDEMLEHGITVALGTDNIIDIYKPFGSGTLWTELKFLLEGLHLYDIDALVNIATVNGRKVLGLVN